MYRTGAHCLQIKPHSRCCHFRLGRCSKKTKKTTIHLISHAKKKKNNTGGEQLTKSPLNTLSSRSIMAMEAPSAPLLINVDDRQAALTLVRGHWWVGKYHPVLALTWFLSLLSKGQRDVSIHWAAGKGACFRVHIVVGNCLVEFLLGTANDIQHQTDGNQYLKRPTVCIGFLQISPFLQHNS